MPSVTVAVLTGLITIFRKNSVIFSPQNTVGDCCSVPYGPTALITIFSIQKSVWLAVEIAHCPMYVAVAALITLQVCSEMVSSRENNSYSGQFD